MEFMKLLGRGTLGIGFVCALILLAGCKSSDKSGSTSDNGPYTFNPLGGSTAAAPANSGSPNLSETPPAPVSDQAAALPSIDNAEVAPIKKGSALTISFHGIYPEVKDITVEVPEDGTIVLTFNEKFVAEGKTARQLQDEIHDRYVPKYYKYMTPTVIMAQGFFSVGGEVKVANRYVWTPGMTVLRAIDAAGGFTDYARKGDVTITRVNTRKQEHEDCLKALKHPEKDLPVYPGDTVFVRKRII